MLMRVSAHGLGWFLVPAGFCGLLGLLGGCALSGGGGIPWQHSLDQAQQESKETGKPILIYFGGST